MNGIIVLDSDNKSLFRAMSAISNVNSDNIVAGYNFRTYISWDNIIWKFETRNCPIRLVVVDSSKKATCNLANDFGILLLKNIRKKLPCVKIFLFDSCSTTSLLQEYLNKGLLNHIEIKKPEEFDNPEYWMVFAKKIQSMVYGEYAGNVSCPNYSDTLNLEFISRWIQCLPEGKKTKMLGINGEIIKAGDFLTDPGLLERFTQVFMSGRRAEKINQSEINR